MDYIQYNWLYSLFGLIIYAVMLCVSRPNVTLNNPPQNNTSNGITIFFLLYIFNSVYGLWEWDTYHIWDDFIGAGRYKVFEIVGYESVYNWLASLTGANYFLWRFIIWTPACLFIYFSAKRLSLLNRNFLVSLALFGGFLAFTRGMLGHTMLIYGLIIIYSSDKNKFAQILGILIIIVSYFFHKSMYVNLIFAALALLPFGRKSILMSIPIFPIAVALTSAVVDYILLAEYSLGAGVGGAGDKTNIYLELEKSEVNSNGYIGQLIGLLPLYLTAYYLYRRIFVKKIFNTDKKKYIYIYFFRLFYVAMYVSSLFYFLGTSQWICQRFRYMALFPLIFVLGKVWQLEPKSNKYIRSIIILQIIAITFKYILQLKNWYTL